MDSGQVIIAAIGEGLSDDDVKARVRAEGHTVSTATVRWYRHNVKLTTKGKRNAKIKTKSRKHKAVKSKGRARN